MASKPSIHKSGSRKPAAGRLPKAVAAMPKPGLPSREELVAFIAAQGGKTDKREIARAFHVKGDERVELKRMLHEL